MHILVGLGNPGKKYARTPHNFGFNIIDRVAHRYAIRLKKDKKIPAYTGGGTLEGVEVLLVKPLTYMNLGGNAVRPLFKNSPYRPEDFYVICDDIHLPIGTLRLRTSGSAGGHKGLLSIIGALGSREFPRLRIGAGVEGYEIDDRVAYVLSPVMKEYRPVVEEILDIAVEAVAYSLLNGYDEAMSRYNGLNLLTEET